MLVGEHREPRELRQHAKSSLAVAHVHGKRRRQATGPAMKGVLAAKTNDLTVE